MSHIAEAASVLLARGSTSVEFFIVRRAASLRFFGGFHAFPGGKVAPADRELPLVFAGASIHQDTTAPERFVTAARELFEETGVLLARRADGSYPAGGSVLEYLRRKLLGEEVTFAQVLQRLDASLHPEDFLLAGSVVTPNFVPTRFDTTFFLARLPENQQAKVWPGELDHGEWASAGSVLQRWTRAECLVSPPTVSILQAVLGRPLAEVANHLRALLSSLAADAIPPIFFAPFVQLLPLFTQALPPSTHTNAYLIGRERVYLIDPGTGLADEQERLFAALDREQGAGRQLDAIILSHHHPDHVEGATACARRYRVPIYAHAVTLEKLRGKIAVDRTIAGGDRLALGESPDGSGPWFLEAVHTPGHATGHLAFYEPRYRLLFAGDMVSTLSSVVIAPPDGDLTVYLQSLRLLQTYDCRLLLPSHGSPTPRALEVLAEFIDHRMKREEQLLAALGAGSHTPAELAGELYKGLLPDMMRFAELQILAGLQKLANEGRVAATGAGSDRQWFRVV